MRPTIFSVLKLFSLLILLMLYSCRADLASVDSVAAEPSRNPAVDVMLIPVDSAHRCYDGIPNAKAIAQFYHGRNGSPVWLQPDGKMNTLADSMIALFGRAAYYGLTAGEYLSGLHLHGALADELQLTSGFLNFAFDLRRGRYAAPDAHTDSAGLALLATVAAGHGLKKTLESQEPDFAGYGALKQALAMSLDGEAGDISQRQMRAIAFSLDQWRKEETIFPQRYVFVNVPSFMLHVVDSGAVVFASKVIVGKKTTPTPDISSIIECFTVYPYWNVPRNIAVNEYLPKIRQDSTFIVRNQFDVLDRKERLLDPDSVDWNSFDHNHFPVRLRQREGPENAMGILKFRFDNPYAIYLHDTNAKALFGHTTRAFSHGCIRVERAEELAHLLITGTPGVLSAVVEQYLDAQEQHTIDLKVPMPVFIRYHTAEAVDGRLIYHEDVYGKDSF